MAKWSELYGIAGSKYTKDTIDFLDKTGHEYYQTTTPAVVSYPNEGMAGLKSFDYKDALTRQSAELMSSVSPASVPSQQSLMDKYRASFVQKTPQELATNPVSRLVQGISSSFIGGMVDVVRGAGTVIEAGVGKIADDIKTGRFVDNLTKMPGDTQALKDDWSRFIDKRNESKITATLAPAISTIQQGRVQDSKAAQAGAFIGGAASYAMLAGASGLAGVAPLFLSSLDNSLTTIEAEGKDVREINSMLRAFGTAAVEVGTEYMFNVLGGMGSKGAAIAARSTIGRSALSRVTGLYDNMAVKASSMFGKFVASTPNPTLTKYVAFLLAKGNEEGFEELASYIGSGFIQLWTTDKDKKPSDVMNAKDAATNYLLGGVMGFAISAVNNVDGLLASMPKTKSKIDSISDKPITEVTPEEMSDVINTIAEEGQSASVQEITNKMTQKAASVAETVNSTADEEYAEEMSKPVEQATAETFEEEALVATDTQEGVQLLTTTGAYQKIKNGTFSDDDASAWLESPEGQQFASKVTTEEQAYETINELASQLDVLAGTRDENGIMRVNLQLTAARQLVDKLQKRMDRGPRKGYAVSEHLEKIIRMIDLASQGDENTRVALRNAISDAEIFHKVYGFEDVVKDADREMGKNIKSKSRSKQKYDSYRTDLIALWSNPSHRPSSEEIVAFNQYIDDAMNEMRSTGEAPYWYQMMASLAIKKASELGQSMGALSFVAKKIKNREAENNIESLRKLFDTPKNEKAQTDGEELAKTLRKERAGIIVDEFTEFQEQLKKEDWVEPEGVPFSVEEKARLKEEAKEKRTMQYRLSRMMRRDYSNLSKPKQDMANKVMRQLYNKYYEVMHAEELMVPKDVEAEKVKRQAKADETFKLMGTLAMDSENLKQVWADALDMMAEFGESSDDLQKVFEILNPLYNQKLVGRVLNETLRAMNFDLRDMAFQHFFDNNRSISEFSNVLRSEIERATGETLSDAEFNYLNKYIIDRLNKAIEVKKFMMRQALENRIERLQGKRGKDGKAYQEKMIQQMMDVAMLDGFKEDAIVDMWKSHLGVPSLTASMQQDIYTTMEKIAKMRLDGVDYYTIVREYDDLVSRIASNVPATFVEKWKAWRGMSMLGQTSNLIRNPLSNISAVPFFGVADRLQYAIESVLKVAPEDRSRGRVFLNAGQDTDSYKYAQSISMEEIQDSMTRSSKLEFLTKIEAKKQIFKNRAMEATRKTLIETMTGTHRNRFLRALGDTPVFQLHYRTALANKLDALGYNTTTDDGARATMMVTAKAYAADIATERTFRKLNLVSQQLIQLRNKGIVPDLVVSAFQPFIVTSAAIGKLTIDFSVAGLAFNGARLANIARKNMMGIEVSTEEKVAVAKGLSLALSGTVGQSLVGAILGAMGFLTGGWPDDDKEKLAWQLSGKQPYSLYAPGVGSVSINWLQPVASGLVLGAEIVQSNGDLSKITDSMLDQLLSQTFAETVISKTQTYNKNEKLGIVGDLLSDYAMQHVPVLGKQLADALDPYERDVYQGTMLDILGYRVMQRTPFIAENISPKYDIWGNPTKKADLGLGRFGNVLAAISPFKVAQDRMDGVTKEVFSVYKESSSSDALPSPVGDKLTYNKKDITLVGKEYERFQELVGQNRKKMVEDAIAKPDWSSMTPALQAKVLNKMYDLGRKSAINTMVQEYPDTFTP